MRKSKQAALVRAAKKALKALGLKVASGAQPRLRNGQVEMDIDTSIFKHF